MPSIRVTQKGIEALMNKPHPKRIDYFDNTHKGLCLTVGPRGGVWYYFRRVDGKLARLRIGAWPTVGIKAARVEAGLVESAIAEGKHPKAEQARQRAEKSESRRLDAARVIDTAAAKWREQHFPTLATSTRNAYEQPFNEFIEAFSGRDMATITSGELVRFLDGVTKRSAAQGNRAATIIRQLFAFAKIRYDLEVNPASDLKNPAKPKRRKRTLNRQEIRELWQACEQVGYPYGPALQMALCTGQRIGEIGSMRWSDIEGDYWRNSDNKSDQRIDIYVAGHARALLDSCPQTGDFVFSNTGEHGIRSDTWGGSSGALARYFRPLLEDMEHFTPHDLRRTVRTGLTGWAGVLPDTAERVLNHSISGLRAHYDFADYKPHVTQALQSWNDELSRILQGEQAAVTPIKKAMA